MVCFALHVLGQVAFGLEAEVAVFACVRPEVAVGPDVFLQHGRFLATNPAALAHVFPAAPTPDVGIVVVRRLVATFHLSPAPLVGDKGILSGKRGMKNLIKISWIVNDGKSIDELVNYGIKK